MGGLAYQSIFRRYEIKYLLSSEQQARILAAMEPYMAPDKYGRTTIRNIYYDTPSYRLIRHSLEKPAYKEKLRIRSYCQADRDTPVFVELKKKYKGVVYKRRLAMPEERAMLWLSGAGEGPTPCQISREIDYFRGFYGDLAPKVFLSYERTAYYCRRSSDFRVTFDRNILFRTDGLSLSEPPGGASILPPGTVLMEIKTAGGIPLWLTQTLTREKIYKTSFSKYGTAYQSLFLHI